MMRSTYSTRLGPRQMLEDDSRSTPKNLRVEQVFQLRTCANKLYKKGGKGSQPDPNTGVE